MDADAIVIGAGAAGLVAARRLAGKKLQVIVLEARNRVGGRVWSHRSGNDATPAELGAEFIHGKAEQTMGLLREAGMSAISTGGESWSCANGSLRHDETDFLTGAKLFERTRSLQSDESAERFLRRFENDGATRAMAALARLFVEGFEAADPSRASALAIAQEWRSGVDLESARPLGGYGPLFERLQRDCETVGAQIRLSARVRAISWRRGGVAVTTSEAKGEQTIRAHAAIVTVPLGVLRQRGGAGALAFEPPLPPAKEDALRGIEMGQVVKVVLRFRSRFWERLDNGVYRNAAFFRCDGQPFATYWTHVPIRSELVVAWAGGPKAIALRNKSRVTVIERARDGFAALFGDGAQARDEFEEGMMHDWEADPFARGAYSYVVVGAGQARAALAAAVDDTVFFAGEATSIDGQGGTVNGAFETGARAGAQVAAVLHTDASRR